MNHGRVATAERIERPLLNAVRRPWKIPGHVAGRLNPALADWTSSHLLASPTQKILAGVSADQRAADRITVVGGLVNVLLTFGKLAAGIYGRSAAMISDAAHSASDLASDVVTLVAMRAARLPADEDHPYGHGRFETVGALVVGGMLVAAGAGAASHALEAGAHAHGALGLKPGKVALVAALVSIVAKEGLFRATARVGKRLRSPVLEANAWHHRSDALSSVVALVGIAAARCSLSIFRHADAAAGLAVAAQTTLERPSGQCADSGATYSKAQECDAVCDCTDCSDEPTECVYPHMGALCAALQAGQSNEDRVCTCNSGAEIPFEWLCDGSSDCGMHEDETAEACAEDPLRTALTLWGDTYSETTRCIFMRHVQNIIFLIQGIAF